MYATTAGIAACTREPKAACMRVRSPGIIGVNTPREPYGIRDRVWKSYSDDRKAEVAAADKAISDGPNMVPLKDMPVWSQVDKSGGLLPVPA